MNCGTETALKIGSNAEKKRRNNRKRRERGSIKEKKKKMGYFKLSHGKNALFSWFSWLLYHGRKWPVTNLYPKWSRFKALRSEKEKRKK